MPGIEISLPKIVDLMEQLAGEVSEQKRTMIILESHYSARQKSHSSPSAYDTFCGVLRLFWVLDAFKLPFPFLFSVCLVEFFSGFSDE